jgi:hypothetical protein
MVINSQLTNKAMKTILINIFALAMLTSISAYATDKDGKNNKEVESAKYTINYDESNGSFNLIYKTYSMRPVNVYIYNEQHQLVFTDRIKESGILSRPYNFKSMKPGIYTFKIVENNRIVDHIVEYKPTVRKCPYQIDVTELIDGRFRLSVIGQTELPVKVRILNVKNTPIFSETIKENNSFIKVYNLNKLDLTNCIFEVMIDNQVVFNQSF